MIPITVIEASLARNDTGYCFPDDLHDAAKRETEKNLCDHSITNREDFCG